jgi:hypothetical protein
LDMLSFFVQSPQPTSHLAYLWFQASDDEANFYAPDHKMSGALCHGICVGVRKHLVSINYRTNAWVAWSDFSVAYWGWLGEGSFRWSAPPLIQDGHYSLHLGFDFRRLEDKRLGRWIRFFCGLLGVTRGRFLSMISSAAHPRWPPLVTLQRATHSCCLGTADVTERITF